MARKPVNDAETIRRINEKNSNKEFVKTPWSKLPEHVQRNILRAKESELQRKKSGRKLPMATFVSGGKISPK